MPKATSTDSSRLRSRNCSSWETSIEAAISSSTTVAPTWRPVRTLSYMRSRATGFSSTKRIPGSIRYAVLRTYSAMSGTRSSTRICATIVAPGSLLASSAPVVAMIPWWISPIGSLRAVTVGVSAGSVHRNGSRPMPSPIRTVFPLRAVRSTHSACSSSPGGCTTKASPSSQRSIRASSRRVAQVPMVSEVVGVTSSSAYVPGLVAYASTEPITVSTPSVARNRSMAEVAASPVTSSE